MVTPNGVIEACRSFPSLLAYEKSGEFNDSIYMVSIVRIFLGLFILVLCMKFDSIFSVCYSHSIFFPDGSLEKYLIVNELNILLLMSDKYTSLPIR